MSEKNRKTVIGNKRPKTTNINNSDSVPVKRQRPKSSGVSQHTQVYTNQKSTNPNRNKNVLKDQYSQIRKNKARSEMAAKTNAERAWEKRQQDFERRRKSANRRAQVPTIQKTAINNSTIATDYEHTQNKRKKHTILKILIGILVVFAVLLASVYAYARFTPLNPDLSGNIGLYNISSNAAAVGASHRIANIAIFGIDGREDVEGERSDAIMIGSADFEHNKLKVTSLMRDTYTEMAEYDYFDKLNAAYSLGGPEEALRTINLNFDTPITDYIVFDFTALVAMVNSVGGVDIDVQDEEELYWINQYLMDVNDKVGTADPDVTGTGVQHLTGSQALAYARIRYVGNGDYDRTQRQRNILQQVVARATSMSPFEQLDLLQKMLPYIQTTLRTSELIKYALNFVLMGDKTVEQSRLPQDGLLSDGYLDGVSYIFPETLDDNIRAWYRFVYEIDYVPSPTAQKISEEIEYTWY